MDDGKWVRLQRHVEVLRVFPTTTAAEIEAFDRDFRMARWMWTAGGSLVRLDGGSTQWVDNETFYGEYGLIPDPAGATVAELPGLVGKQLAHLEEIARDDRRFVVVLFEVTD